MYNYPLELKKAISSTPKVTGHQPKKLKTRPIKNIRIEIRLSSTIFFLLIQLSLKLRFQEKQILSKKFLKKSSIY